MFASLSSMTIMPMSVAVPGTSVVTKTSPTTGSLNGFGTYSWDASSTDGNIIAWTFIVNQINNLTYQRGGYLEFKIPENLELVGNITTASGNPIRQSTTDPSRYFINTLFKGGIGGANNISLTVSFQTRIKDTTTTNLNIDFKPAIKEAVYLRPFVYFFKFHHAGGTSTANPYDSNIETTDNGTANAELIAPEVIPSKPASLSLTRFGSLKINKVDENNLPLKGASFELRRKSDNILLATLPMTNVSTDTITNIPFGDYLLNEVNAPLGYQASLPREIHIGSTVEHAVTISNTLLKGNLEVLKTDENNLPLSGAEFQLVGRTVTGKDITYPANGSLVTGLDGKLTFSNIEYGNYRLIETKAPNGYNPSANIDIVIDKSAQAITVKNTKIPTGDIVINKMKPDGTVLQGAEFTLSGNGITPMTITTDAEGKAHFSNVMNGTYLLRETKSPAGYEAAMDRVVIVNSDTVNLDIINVPTTKGKLILTKYSEDGARLAGVDFTLTRGSDTPISATTDINGVAIFDQLLYGEYQLKELSVPAGHLPMPDKTITIDKATQAMDIYNFKTLATGSITIKNTDLEDPNISLAGAVFTVTGITASGNQVNYTVKADANGEAKIANLPMGKYTVTQIKAPEGYSLMPNNLIFDLPNEQGMTDATVMAQNKKMPDEGSLPYIEIDVKDQLDHSNIDKVVVKLVGSDGSVRYKTTGTDGKVIFEKLDYGISYIGTIDDAPYRYKWEGHTPPSTPALTLTPVSPVANSTIFLKSVEKNKLMLRVQEYGDIDIKIAGARFLITDPDGGTVEVTTGPDGTTEIELWHGNYSVQQLTTDATHLIDPIEYSIFIERHEELVILNKLIDPALSKKSVTVTKSWEDPPPTPKPDIEIILMADGTEIDRKTILASSTDQNLVFPDLPKYNSNHDRIQYTVKEETIDGYYALYEIIDHRGYEWKVKNYEGFLIGDCKTGTFWVSNSTSAVEYTTNGNTTNRQIKMTTGVAGATDQNDNSYGYSIALSRDGKYFYAVNRRGYLRIWDLSGTNPVELTVSNDNSTFKAIYLRRENGSSDISGGGNYVHAAEVSNDGTKLFVKARDSNYIYEYDTANLLAEITKISPTLNATQAILANRSAGDIVYLENGDLLYTGLKPSPSLDSNGLWISRINADGTYGSPKQVGITDDTGSPSSLKIEGIGLVNGQLVRTSVVGGVSKLYYMDPLPNRDTPANQIYTYTEFINTATELGDLTDMTSGSDSTCYGVITIAGQKLWENDTPEDRPDSITVWLYKNGVKTDKSLVVNANTGWTYQFENLEKYENNIRIQYSVKEEQVPDGYIALYPNSETEPNNHNITNRLEAADLYLLKKNETGAMLPGVQFTMYSEDKLNIVSGPEFTNEQGRISFTGLKIGKYLLKETSTAVGYALDPNYYPVEVYRDELTGRIKARVTKDGVVYENSIALPIELINYPIAGEFEIEKKNTQGQVLPGALFTLGKVVDGGTLYVGEATSDANGKLKFQNLEKGNYILTETKAPTGYTPNNTVYSIVVDEEGKVKVTVDGKELSSTPLTIYNQPEDTAGYINITKTIYEDGKANISRINGVTFELRISNAELTQKEGALVGRGSGSSLPGIAITSTLPPVGSVIAENGMASFTGLIDGYYYLKETVRPNPPTGARWTEPMAELFIKVENGISYVWKNDRWIDATLDGSMNDSEYAIDVYNPYSNNPLKGSLDKLDGHNFNRLQTTFQLYRGEEEATATPYYDSNGQAVILETSLTGKIEFDLPSVVGNYWLKEIKPPEGYDPVERLVGPMIVTQDNGGLYTVSMDTDQTEPPLWVVNNDPNSLEISVYNRKDRYPLRIEKVDENGQPISNPAVFEVVKKGETNPPIEIFITTENGIGVTDAIFEPGDYIIYERVAPEGYQIFADAIEVNLDAEGNWTLVNGNDPFVTANGIGFQIMNESIKYEIALKKVDGNGEILNSDFAEFKLYDSNSYHIENGRIQLDDPMNATPIAELSTKDGAVDGLVVSFPVFTPGKYALFETKTPEGYWGLPEPIEVELKVEGGVPTWTITHGRADFVKIDDAGVLEITNRLAVYPSTGGIGVAIFVLAGFVLMGTAILMMKKRENRI